MLRVDYWANVGFWWDLEFWNSSVDHEIGAARIEFSGTPHGTFPKSSTSASTRAPARSNVDVDPASPHSRSATSRFRLRGSFLATQRNVRILIRPAEPWRADWITSGLYDDGWTRPGRVAARHGLPRRRHSTEPAAVAHVRARRAGRRHSDGRSTFASNLGTLAHAVGADSRSAGRSSSASRRSGFGDVTIRATGSLADPRRPEEHRRVPAAARRRCPASGRSRSRTKSGC